MQYVGEGRMKCVQEGPPIDLSNPCFKSSAPDSEKTFKHQIPTSTTDSSSNKVFRTSTKPTNLNLKNPYQRYSFTKERGHENQSSYTRTRNQKNDSGGHPHQSKAPKPDIEILHKPHPLVKSRGNEFYHQHFDHNTMPHQSHYTYYKPVLNLPPPDFVLPNMVPVFYNPQDADDWAKAGATLTKMHPDLPQAFEYKPASCPPTQSNVPIEGPKFDRISSQNNHSDGQNNVYGGPLEPFNPGYVK